MSREDNICTKSFLKTVLEYPDRKDLLINFPSMIKFIFSEKATNFCEISTVDLSDVVKDKFTVEISQNFVAFSEYMNFSS